MLYIHHTSCISPQKTYGNQGFSFDQKSVDGKLLSIEPDYSGIPPGILRRMGKAVRMGVGAALPLLHQQTVPDGIILGTAIGGMEDCIKFLNQIVQYEEGMLTPGNFVQSTPNAVASQIGLMTKNTGYNITHVHRGLAFEMALLDAIMMSEEHPAAEWLVGGVDEISAYNYNIERLGGWYKNGEASSENLFVSGTPGSIAGEGAAMFRVSGIKENAIAAVKAIETIHTNDPVEILKRWRDFLKTHFSDQLPELIITGDNGDARIDPYYKAVQEASPSTSDILRFKHLSGEFPTASGFALWLALSINSLNTIPASAFVAPRKKAAYHNAVIYNNYKGDQHSFTLIQYP